MLPGPDAKRSAELAALARAGAVLDTCVHMRLGLCEVLEKRDDRWAFRQRSAPFVEDREPNEFRPLMSAGEAQRVLEELAKAEATQATDAERRAWLKKFDPNKQDLRKPLSVAKKLAHFAGLKAAGLELWTMEKSPATMLWSRLAEEIAAVTREPVAQVAGRFP
jgi:hypothetical protein